MPQPIKYTTTNPSNAIRKGNIALGVNDTNYGPSTSTGWAGGVNMPSGGYIINYTSGTNVRIRTAANDSQLITVAGQIMGTTYATVADAISGLVGGGFIVNNNNPPNIVNSGLAYYIDSTLLPSYPTANTTAYPLNDTGSVGNGTLQNGVGWSSNSKGFIFDGSDDQILISNSDNFLNVDWSTGFTLAVLYKIDAVTDFNGQFRCMIGVTGGGRTWNYYLYGSSTPATQLQYHFSGMGGGGLSNSLTITTGSYHLGTFTIVPGTSVGTYYHDGVSAGTQGATTTPAYITAGGNQYLGRGDNMWKGNIARWMLYNKALSQAEIFQNYYQGNIVTDNLSYVWDAGNLISYPGSGTTTYNMTGSVNGTLVNGLGFSGNNGGIWVFDGTDDAITLDSTVYFGGSSTWTVSMWVKADSFNSNYGTLFSNNSGGPVTTAFGVTSGYISYQNYNGAWQEHLGNTALSTNTWYHLTWANSSNSMTMYVNGVADSSAFASNDTNSGPVNSIGRNWYATFPGSIGSLITYTGKRLTVSEIQQNFNAQRNRFNI